MVWNQEFSFDKNLIQIFNILRFIDSHTFSCDLDPVLYLILKDIKPKMEG